MPQVYSVDYDYYSVMCLTHCCPFHSFIILLYFDDRCSCTVGYVVAWLSIIRVDSCMVTSQFSTVHMLNSVQMHIYIFVQLCIMTCDNFIPTACTLYTQHMTMLGALMESCVSDHLCILFVLLCIFVTCIERWTTHTRKVKLLIYLHVLISFTQWGSRGLKLLVSLCITLIQSVADPGYVEPGKANTFFFFAAFF